MSKSPSGTGDVGLDLDLHPQYIAVYKTCSCLPCDTNLDKQQFKPLTSFSSAYPLHAKT